MNWITGWRPIYVITPSICLEHVEMLAELQAAVLDVEYVSLYLINNRYLQNHSLASLIWARANFTLQDSWMLNLFYFCTFPLLHSGCIWIKEELHFKPFQPSFSHFSVCSTNIASRYRDHFGQENWDHQLKLAVAWNRVDIARSEIFTDDHEWKVWRKAEKKGEFWWHLGNQSFPWWKYQPWFDCKHVEMEITLRVTY